MEPLAVPPKTLDQLLSHNTAALQWNAFVSTKVGQVYLVGCLND